MTKTLVSSATRTWLAVLVASALAALGAGCPRGAHLPELDALTDQLAARRARASGARRVRLVGTVKAKLPGLQGMIGSADLDIALQPPAMLSIAVRSFFEQPMQMLVTDGEQLTIFDATQGEPVFLRGRADARSLSRVLPLPLSPRETVSIFLARPPTEGPARLLGVDHQAGTFELWLEPPDQGPCQLTVRADDDAILRWRAFRGDGLPLLDVRYGDLRAAGDATVPFSWSVRRLDVTPEQALTFTATNVSWNGPPLPDEAFRLEPPPGTPLRPLGNGVLR